MSEALTLRDMVCEQVRSARAEHGPCLDRAYEVVARRLGCVPRRVRAWWYDEIKDPRDSEANRIRQAYCAWLEREERLQEQRLAEMRTRRVETLRRLEAIEARL